MFWEIIQMTLVLIGIGCWLAVIILANWYPNSWIWFSAICGIIGGLCIGISMNGFVSGLVTGFIYGILWDVLVIPSGLITRHYQEKAKVDFRKRP